MFAGKMLSLHFKHLKPGLGRLGWWLVRPGERMR